MVAFLSSFEWMAQGVQYQGVTQAKLAEFFFSNQVYLSCSNGLLPTITTRV
jgi:hypothetical protein